MRLSDKHMDNKTFLLINQGRGERAGDVKDMGEGGTGPMRVREEDNGGREGKSEH